MKATPEDVAKVIGDRPRFGRRRVASMKATPEDVAKQNLPRVGPNRGPKASMKATPEDVAKSMRSTRRSAEPTSRLNEGHARRRGEAESCMTGPLYRSCPLASMKATPEDVAKQIRQETGIAGMPGGLNEGHARRRGEATSQRWRRTLPVGRLNEGHARRRGEAHRTHHQHRTMRTASMKATPEDVAKIGVLSAGSNGT